MTPNYIKLDLMKVFKYVAQGNQYQKEEYVRYGHHDKNILESITVNIFKIDDNSAGDDRSKYLRSHVHGNISTQNRFLLSINVSSTEQTVRSTASKARTARTISWRGIEI